MMARVRHPVPVRYPAARAPRDLVAYHAADSVVEIPEVAPGTFARDVRALRVQLSERELSWVGGTAWEPVRPWDVGGAGKGGVAPLGAVIAALAEGGGRDEGRLGRSGTPLRGTSYPLPRQPDPCGRRLPDAVLRRARHDLTEASRAGLARFFAENMATDGSGLWIRTCPPVFKPNELPRVSAGMPDYVTRGPCFPPGRVEEIRDYIAATHSQRANLGPWAEDLAKLPPIPDEAYAEMDVAQFVCGAPALLERAAERLMQSLGRAGDVLPGPVAEAFERLRPIGDLGLVGAIPRERWGEAVDATLAVASAIRSACRDGYRPEFLPWVEAYHRIVARPRLGQGAAPEEDLAELARLSP